MLTPRLLLYFGSPAEDILILLLKSSILHYFCYPTVKMILIVIFNAAVHDLFMKYHVG